MKQTPPMLTEADTHKAPVEYRDWAFELWAFEYGGVIAQVKKRIENPQEDDPLPARHFAYNTIKYWCEYDKWPDMLRGKFHQLAPNMHETILQNLLISGVHYSRFILQLSQGQVPMNTAVEVNAVRMQIEGAKIAFDRTGIMPHLLSSDRSKPAGPQQHSTGAIGTMTPEELMEAMNKRMVVRDIELVEMYENAE